MNALRYGLCLAMLVACAAKPTPAAPAPPPTVPSSTSPPAESSAAAPLSEPSEPSEPPPTGACATQECEVEEALTMMRSFADSMCKCSDMACAEAVTDAMVAYGEAMARRHEGKAEPAVTDVQQQAMDAAIGRIKECVTKAVGG